MVVVVFGALMRSVDPLRMRDVDGGCCVFVFARRIYILQMVEITSGKK